MESSIMKMLPLVLIVVLSVVLSTRAALATSPAKTAVVSGTAFVHAPPFVVQSSPVLLQAAPVVVQQSPVLLQAAPLVVQPLQVHAHAQQVLQAQKIQQVHRVQVQRVHSVNMQRSGGLFSRLFGHRQRTR